MSCSNYVKKYFRDQHLVCAVGLVPQQTSDMLTLRLQTVLTGSRLEPSLKSRIRPSVAHAGLSPPQASFSVWLSSYLLWQTCDLAQHADILGDCAPGSVEGANFLATGKLISLSGVLFEKLLQ